MKIFNGDEFHNFLRKKVFNDDIIYLKMPNILIKYSTKEEFFVDLVNKYHFSRTSDLAKYLSENYGHNKLSIQANINLDKIKMILNSGLKYSSINKEIKLDQKEIDLLKKEFMAFSKERSYIDMKETILFFESVGYSKQFINNSILNNFGYQIMSPLFIQKQNWSILDEFRNILNEKGIYKNELSELDCHEIESRFQNDLDRNDIIQINNNSIVTYNYFFKITNINLNVELNRIKKIIYKYLNKQEYLSINSLKEEKINLLNDGFIDVVFFLKFISRKIKTIKYEKFVDTYIIRKKSEIKILEKICKIIEKNKMIDKTKLLDNIETMMGERPSIDVDQILKLNSKFTYLENFDLIFSSKEQKNHYIKSFLEKSK